MNAEPRASTWHTASVKGTRTHNADAVASNAGPAGLVVALADGIGDHRGAARAALVAASAAVRAPLSGGPVAALAAAQEAVMVDPEASDCVLVLAQPTAFSYQIAWVGDVRAYAWTGTDLHQVTTDHTLAQYFRSRGVPVTPRMEHTVLTSIRTATPAHFGHTTLPTPASLLLTTDGVHRTLARPAMAELLRYAADPAAALVAAANDAGVTDNATAVLLDHAHLPPTTPQPTLPVAA
jgi:serine/threonine protein phosphatase PrpC